MADKGIWEDEDGRLHDANNGNQYVSKDVVDANEELKAQQLQYYAKEQERKRKEMTATKIMSFHNRYEKIKNVKGLNKLRSDVEKALELTPDTSLQELLNKIDEELSSNR